MHRQLNSLSQMLSLSIFLFTLILPLVMLLQGCSPGGAGKPLVRPIEGGQRPIPTQIEVEPGSRQLLISWTLPFDDRISGYNVYLGVSSEVDGKREVRWEDVPHNDSIYPGDTDPDDPRIEYLATGLENGEKYLIRVAAVSVDGTELISEELPSGIPRPSGEFTIAIRGRGEPDGYCFNCEKTVGSKDLLNDLYFFSKDGIDYLNAPSRQEGLLKENTLIPLPFKGSFKQIRSRQREFTGRVGGDKVTVKPGDWVLFQSPEKEYTLVEVRSLQGTGDQRTVTCRYVASASPKELSF